MMTHSNKRLLIFPTKTARVEMNNLTKTLAYFTKLNVETLHPNLLFLAENTNGGGRLSTGDLLIKVARW
jgi:hypothetical protein